MRRLCGVETEYGIQVDGVEDMDVVVESMELLRCYSHQDFVAIWTYALENPRLDMRGFEVDGRAITTKLDAGPRAAAVAGARAGAGRLRGGASAGGAARRRGAMGRAAL